MNSSPFQDNLSERVAAIREMRSDMVPVGEVAEVVESLMTTMEGDISAFDIGVHREIQSLVDFIQKARQEIASIQLKDIPDTHIPNATDELDAVVAATEVATNQILDAAEKLEEMADSLEGENAARVTEITTQIYEASNFQDITGQRITKVVTTLRQIEDRVMQLAIAIGEVEGDTSGDEVKSAVASEQSDESLLSGPQMPDVANSQDDIDALLASFD